MSGLLVRIPVSIEYLVSKIHESVCPVCGVIESVELWSEQHSDALLWTIHGHYVLVTCEDCKTGSCVGLAELARSLKERGIVRPRKPRYPKLLQKLGDHVFWADFEEH